MDDAELSNINALVSISTVATTALIYWIKS